MMKKFKSVIALLLALIMTASVCVSAFAADIEETDGNDSAETATSFTLNDSVKGRLDTEADVDYYTYEVEKAGIACVIFEHAKVDAPTSYFTVQAFNSDLELVTEFRIQGQNEKTESTMFSVPVGTHYLAVSIGQTWSGTLEYKMTVKVDTEARSEIEPNNEVAQATKMDYSTSSDIKVYTANLTQDDIDYFVVDLKSDGFVYLSLYNSNGTRGEYTATFSKYIEGAEGYANLARVGSVTITTSDDNITSVPVGVSAGKYYIAVNGSVGGYKIRLFFSESVKNYETEYNNSFSDANTYVLGKEIVGSLFDSGDVDYFKFAVTNENREQKLVVSVFETADINARWNVTVYDRNGKYITSVDASKNAPAEIALNDYQPGVYYVAISTAKVYASTERYIINSVEHKVEKPKTFWETIKSIDWSTFLNNFKGWLGQIDFAGITKSIYLSIKAIIASLRGNG